MMRCLLVLLVGLWILLGDGTPLSRSAEKGKRYGIALDLKTYPQDTPRKALTSVLKALDNKRTDYLVAHLADPKFIDDRVKRLHGGDFSQQVKDTQTRLDPFAVRLLRRFLKEGEWTTEKNQASVRLAKGSTRRVYLRKQDDRWFLEHRNTPPKKKSEE